MRIAKLLAFAGPNIWSRNPVLEVVLERCSEIGGGEFPLDQQSGRLIDWYNVPAGDSVTPGVDRPRFLQKLAGARHPADLFAVAVQELQSLAGTPVTESWIRIAGPQSTASVAVEFVEEPIARIAAAMAARLLWRLTDAPVPEFEGCVRELRHCAKQVCFGGTTGPIVAAALARRIPVVRLDGDCLVQLGHGVRQRRAMGSITSRTGFLSETISRDKALTKRLISQLGIPVPPGRLVADAGDAWAAACELGLPVVVKPRDEDCGTGVSLMLKTREQVVRAYAQARQFRPDVLVERHLPGAAHRLFVVNDRLVAAVRRDPPQIVGDGLQSIAQLVAAANRDPRRGDGPEQPLFPIVIDDEVEQTLADQRLALNSIPLAGHAITLRQDPKAGYGGTLREVTEFVHPQTAEAVCSAVRVTGLDVAGVDVMAVDIAVPLEAQEGAILEVNAEPAIYLHRRPVCEPSRPVAEAIVDSLIPAGETGRIPIVAVVGDAATTIAARHAARMLEAAGQTVGVATADGIQVGPAGYKRVPANDANGCRALLLHPLVETAICELSLKSLRQDGLAFDECEVAVLASRPDPLDMADFDAKAERCLRVLQDSVAASGAVIVNVDDDWLAGLFTPGERRLIAVSRDAEHAFLLAHRAQGGRTVFADHGAAVMDSGDRRIARQSMADTTDNTQIVSSLLAFATAWALGHVAGQPLPRQRSCLSAPKGRDSIAQGV